MTERAFQSLIEKFTSTPILRHFDPELPIVLEADALDFALGAVISQRSQEGTLLCCILQPQVHPCGN
jgi:RNase H-like domain found in reverse transcriptase